VQQAEKQIEELERQMSQLSHQMADADFYSQPRHQETLRKYEDLRVELDKAMERWEADSQQLDALLQLQ
jgi:predicted RNase H-like nuclease (RuvC/YqgF family)